MAGVRAVYPKWNEEAGEVRTLEMQINACRESRMGAEPWGYTCGDMVNMTALLSAVSRGMPVNVAIDGPAQSTWEQGKEIYYTRYGQLELSCANCHEDNYGNMIRADHLSQGQINGFPAYRLKNTKLNSVHDRFKGCIRDTRARDLQARQPGVRGAGALCRLARQRAVASRVRPSATDLTRPRRRSAARGLFVTV